MAEKVVYSLPRDLRDAESIVPAPSPRRAHANDVLARPKNALPPAEYAEKKKHSKAAAVTD